MTSTPILAPLFGWRGALSSADGPPSPTTRHVLLVLSLWMSAKGSSAYPSIATLVAASGLARRTVIAHLAIASELGWIHKETTPMPAQGRGWHRCTYSAAIPGSAGVVQELHRQGAADARGGAADARGGAANGNEVVQEVHPMKKDDEDDDGDASSSSSSHEPDPDGDLDRMVIELQARGDLSGHWDDAPEFLLSVSDRLARGQTMTAKQASTLRELHAATGSPERSAADRRIPARSVQLERVAGDVERLQLVCQEWQDDGRTAPAALLEALAKAEACLGRLRATS